MDTHASDCPATRHRHRPGASASPATPVPLPPGSSSCAMGTSEVKEMFSFMENLYPIKISWEASARAACHLPTLHEPCPQRALRCSCPPSQRFPKLHTKAKTPSMHSHASLSSVPPSCPVAHHGPRGALPTLAWTCGPSVGDEEPVTSPPAVPSHPPCSGSRVTYASICVPSCVPGVPGWGRLGAGRGVSGRTLPLSLRQF